MEKLNFIDIAKAIGIILVVIGHYYPDNTPAFYENFRTYLYSFHMPLFLFLTGCMYAYTKKEEPVVAFMKKKLKRLAIPYFVISILIISLKLLAQQGVYIENGVDYFSFVRMLYMPEAGYFLWYLWVLLWMYLLCSFSNCKIYLYVLFLLSLLVKFIPEEFPRILCLHELKNEAAFFLLGALFFREKLYLRFKETNLQIFFVVVFIACSFSYFAGFLDSGFIMSFIGTLGIYSLANLMNQGNHNVLLFIGKSSFIIYLFHTIFMGFVKSVIHKISDTMFVDNMLAFLISAMIVVISGLVFPLLLQEYFLKRHKLIGSIFGLRK